MLFNLEIWDSDRSAHEWKAWAEKQLLLDPLCQIPITFNNKNPSDKPKSAFKLFKLDNIVEVKLRHPDFGFKERLSHLKEMWR